MKKLEPLAKPNVGFHKKFDEGKPPASGSRRGSKSGASGGKGVCYDDDEDDEDDVMFTMNNRIMYPP